MPGTTLPEGITRADLERMFQGDARFVRAFEKVLLTVQDSSTASTAAVEATTELQDATAITLSPNAALNNERVLAVTSPLALEDEGAGNRVIIGFGFSFTINDGGRAMIWNLIADTNITFPPIGRLMVSGSTVPVYANDAAAAADGLDVGDIYKQPAGVVVWRQV